MKPGAVDSVTRKKFPGGGSVFVRPCRGPYPPPIVSTLTIPALTISWLMISTLTILELTILEHLVSTHIVSTLTISTLPKPPSERSLT